MTLDWDDSVRLDDCKEGFSWRFAGRVATLVATSSAEVVPVLDRLEAATASGRYAVGFLAYEAASALNPDLPSLPPQEGLPLAWFALFERAAQEKRPSGSPVAGAALKLAAGDQERYTRDVSAIRDFIAAGDCYQANYTFTRSGRSPADCEALYRHILATQNAGYCAWLDTGRFLVLSASPELFFSLEGGRVVTCPMKGTLPRGRELHEDRELKARLAADPKERAENLMIVDLLRNDLGMVAQTGSVSVDALFAVESYPTVHQMTSTVSARLKQGTGLVDLLRALFPCGSVTGAPKKRAMEILASLEEGPRGVYCGAIGMVGPDARASFSVPIRTLVCDREQGEVRLGVGSGITWGSDPAAEFGECEAKGRFATGGLPWGGLIESLRCENGACQRVGQHLERLAWSAHRIGIPCDLDQAASLLLGQAAAGTGVRKVRLLLAPDGTLSVSSEQLAEDAGPVRCALSAVPVEPDDLSLYLKLEDRARYRAARGEHPEADEVLLVNKRGELTEGSYHNLVLRLGGRLVTPPLSCGLLPGIMRQSLLASGTLCEEVVHPSDLQLAEEIWLVNSVRGWRRAELVPGALPAGG